MQKNKVLLIQPENLYLRYNYVPLGLISIGTTLKNKGYDVEIIPYFLYQMIKYRYLDVQCVNWDPKIHLHASNELKKEAVLSLLILTHYNVPIEVVKLVVRCLDSFHTSSEKKLTNRIYIGKEMSVSLVLSTA